MAPWDFITKRNVKETVILKPSFKVKGFGKIEEAKGLIEKPTTFRPELGEEHPFDFQIMENYYQKIPLITGGINKTVDLVVGGRYFIKTKNIQLQQLLEDFIIEQNFELLLRNIVRDVLIYGNSFVEIVSNGITISNLIVRNPKYMYTIRDDEGNVINYVQRVKEMKGRLGTQKNLITFAPNEIAHFKLNVIGDSAYGISIIKPLENILYKKLNMENDMAVLINRKANSPIIIYVGNEENKPQDSDITTLATDLETLTPMTEWVFPYTVKAEAINFGDIGAKFTIPLQHIENQIIYGIEVPAVLLGLGNIPEGLATAQLDVFQKRIESIRLNIEKTLEDNILKPYAEVNGFTDDFDFEWEPRDDEDKWKEVQNIQQLLSTGGISIELKQALQKKISDILDLNITTFTEPTPQQQFPFLQQSYNGFKSETIQEFVGFDYKKFINSILTFLIGYEFDEIESLTDSQKEQLKLQMQQSLENNETISELSNRLQSKLGLNEIDADRIARTETVRVINKGFVNSYKDKGVEKVEWVTIVDSRTDDRCNELDGQQFDIGNIPELPVHVNCRCRVRPIV